MAAARGFKLTRTANRCKNRENELTPLSRISQAVFLAVLTLETGNRKIAAFDTFYADSMYPRPLYLTWFPTTLVR